MAAKRSVAKAADKISDSSGGFTSPHMNSSMTFQNVGSRGLRQFSGWVREEFLPQLVGRQAARVYREMYDNSAIIGALMFTIQQALRSVEWRTIPADATPAAVAEADFAESLRTDMSHTWEQFISEALTMLPYGYAPHEIVYKRRTGRQSNDPSVTTSNYSDGRIGWAELPIRGQDTILKWFFDTNGNITGLTQQPWVGSIVDIPAEKFLLFRPMAHKNNPEGRSILRNCYRPYYFQKRMEELEAILFERMSGVPMMKVPGKLLEAANKGDAQAVAAVAAYQLMITNIRIDEQMGIMIPSDCWMGPNGPSNVPQFDFQLVTPNAGRMLVDSDVSIERYKLEQLTTALADFIYLGHSARGTQSLATVKTDMFFGGIESFNDAIVSELNGSGLGRIWRLNGIDPALKPKFQADLAQRMDLDVLSNFILRVSQAGMMMFPDEDLENWVKQAAGMPDMNEEGDFATSGASGAGEDVDIASVKKMLKNVQGQVDLMDVESMKTALKAIMAKTVMRTRRRALHRH